MKHLLTPEAKEKMKAARLAAGPRKTRRAKMKAYAETFAAQREQFPKMALPIIDQAEIESREVKFLYKNKEAYWFCEANDPSKRFSVEEEVVGQGGKYLKANTIVSQLMFGDSSLGFKLPITVDLKVTEAPPNVKGDSATSGGKVVVLETGATINAPLFVNVGDVIKINTETGEYKERVGK